MSNTHRSIVVALEHEMTEEAALSVCRTIKALRNVADAKPGEPLDSTQWLADVEAKSRLEKKILKALYPEMEAS